MDPFSNQPWTICYYQNHLLSYLRLSYSSSMTRDKTRTDVVVEVLAGLVLSSFLCPSREISATRKWSPIK